MFVFGFGEIKMGRAWFPEAALDPRCAAVLWGGGWLKGGG